jgi:hypothetical protein
MNARASASASTSETQNALSRETGRTGVAGSGRDTLPSAAVTERTRRGSRYTPSRASAE